MKTSTMGLTVEELQARARRGLEELAALRKEYREERVNLNGFRVPKHGAWTMERAPLRADVPPTVQVGKWGWILVIALLGYVLAHVVGWAPVKVGASLAPLAVGFMEIVPGGLPFQKSDTYGALSVYNVEDFLAKHDGVTDDRASVNAAITAANAAGGGIVWSPKGTYAMSGSILAKSNVIFQGVGQNVTTFLMTAAAQSHLMNVEANSPSNWEARDMTLDGNNLITVDCIGGGINATQCRFNGVEMKNSLGHGASIIGAATRFEFVQCRVTGTILGAGIRLRPDVILTVTEHKVLFCEVGQTSSFGISLRFGDENLVAGCTVVGTAAGATNEAINMTDSNSNRILGNKCRNRNDSGIVTFSGAVGNACHFNVIVGNWCQDNLSQGIAIDELSSGNVVVGNFCRNNNRGGVGILSEIKIDTGTANKPTFNLVEGNVLWCDTAGRSTTGVQVNGVNCEDNTIGDNVIGGGQITAELVDTGTRTRYRGRKGGFSTPAALAAGAVNDYAPGEFETLRLTGDAGGTSVLNGFTGGYNNRVLRVINIGAVNIGFGHQQAGSAAANRIITATAAQVNLPGVDDYADFLYDPISARWRLINVTV